MSLQVVLGGPEKGKVASWWPFKNTALVELGSGINGEGVWVSN